MPELPEVETVRRSLLPALTGRTIESITIGNFPGVIGNMSIDELRGLERLKDLDELLAETPPDS